jgi:hypothetical protein
MRRSALLNTCCLIVALLPGWMPAARADMELKDAGGRAVLLKDDGTWRYLDAKDGEAGAAAAAATAASAADKPRDMAALQLLRQVESASACRYEFELHNTLPYEIRSLVPYFAVSRASGVVYAVDSLNFGPVRPGDKTRRALRFAGIACAEIAKVQVEGGDRCEMGELNKFSDAKGECLARLRVLPSELVKFEK